MHGLDDEHSARSLIAQLGNEVGTFTSAAQRSMNNAFAFIASVLCLAIAGRVEASTVKSKRWHATQLPSNTQSKA
jgi:hypothetical protein